MLEIERSFLSEPDVTRRPGLVYQHALDWLALQLSGGAQWSCVTSSLLAGSELIHRVPQVSFARSLPPRSDEFCRAMGRQPASNVQPANGSLDAVAWLEPVEEDREVISQFRHWLRPGGYVYVVTGGWLARFLYERRTIQRDDFLAVTEVTRLLTYHGFQIRGQIGIQGLRAVWWHYLSFLARLLSRPDWQDRCHFAMRRDFVSGHVRSSLFAMNCLTAQAN